MTPKETIKLHIQMLRIARETVYGELPNSREAWDREQIERYTITTEMINRLRKELRGLD